MELYKGVLRSDTDTLDPLLSMGSQTIGRN